MPVAIAEEGIIPKDRVCKICKDNLKANVREATTVLQKDEKQQELVRQKGEEEERGGAGGLEHVIFSFPFHL
jgi:hypothetical protein